MFFSVASMANNNGYKLLSAQGMETLQTFLRDHGNECIRQFVQVKDSLFSQPREGLSHFM
jgi:myo-inositol-hexaphosphate 3-phosphohydrolase